MHHFDEVLVSKLTLVVNVGTLDQWFSTLEARRSTKDEYEHFWGPQYNFNFVSFTPLIEIREKKERERERWAKYN